MKQLLPLCLLLLSVTLSAQTKESKPWDTPQSYPAQASQGQLLGVIPPLRDLKPHTKPLSAPPQKLWRKWNYFKKNDWNNPDALPVGGDPLVKPLSEDQPGRGPEILPELNFEGIRDPNVTPPDPTGDIGKNHYVQMVNTSGGGWFQVWDKEGNSVYGPALTSTIWSQVGSGSIGDPIIVYDHDAERWLMMEMQGWGGGIMLAISDDSDPTGGWKAYVFQTEGFPDYPKLYVWPDAYYVTVNEITSGNVCSGYALEKAALLDGSSTFKSFRFQMPNYNAIQYQPATGADWEIGPPPPPGSPGYIFRVYDDAWDGGSDHLQVWEVHVDWDNVGQSSLDGPLVLNTSPFETRVCFFGLFDCIEQPTPGAPRITSLENIIMYRAPYQNWGAYETVVMNHVTDMANNGGDGGDAAIRWYELRKYPGEDWEIYQEGTFAPDLVTNRFMSTLSMDGAGNIALGYTVCSEETFPGVRITGRRNGDPLGEMTIDEFTLVEGEQSHFDERWGDYSVMAVDPEDERTFWFTSEYQPAGVIWGTRIGSFRIQRDTYDIAPITLKNPIPNPTLGDETVSVEVFNGGIAEASGFSLTLKFEGQVITTEQVDNVVIPSEGTYVHTFATPVTMNVPGKHYNFEVITQWTPDSFVKNDTLRTSVRKLTSNDAAIAGRVNFPTLICSSQQNIGLVLQNASGAQLNTAEVRYRVNTQFLQIYNWTGNLDPGEKDTIYLAISDIQDGLNTFEATTRIPNGLQDEDVTNDSTYFKFFGNTDGAYLQAKILTQYGSLEWALYDDFNTLLADGEVSDSLYLLELCTDDNACYRLSLKSKGFEWFGSFRLLDIYGDALIEATAAYSNPIVFEFCTPNRLQKDVGAFSLTKPVSSGNLGAAEPVEITVRNFGVTPQTDISVSYRFEGGPWHEETLPGTLPAGQTATHTFATTEDLSQLGQGYDFEFRATVQNDENTENDTEFVTVWNRFNRDLQISDLRIYQACNDPNNVVISMIVTNNGLTPISYFEFTTAINGEAPLLQGANVFLEGGQSTEYIFYVFSGATFGNNQLDVQLTSVNFSGADDNSANDSATLGFSLDPNGFGLSMSVYTDDKPQETTWNITDQQGNPIIDGGPFSLSFWPYFSYLCLQKDSCYVLHLYDAGGDGMNGFLDLSVDGINVFSFSGGNFGAELATPFCATSPCAGFELGGIITPASNWSANDGSISVEVEGGGTPPFLYQINFGALQDSPIFSGLYPGGYTINCIDAQGCQIQIYIDLGIVATQEPGKLRRVTATPNPTKGMVRVEMPANGDEQDAVCEVINMKGKRLHSTRMARWDDTLRGMVALETYPSGAYFLVVIDKTGRRYTTKVVKE